MGCGVSRPLTDDQSVGPEVAASAASPSRGLGIRPMIQRRIDELRGRKSSRSITATSTPSRKLLMEGEIEDEDDTHSHSQPDSSTHDEESHKIKHTTEDDHRNIVVNNNTTNDLSSSTLGKEKEKEGKLPESDIVLQAPPLMQIQTHGNEGKRTEVVEKTRGEKENIDDEEEVEEDGEDDDEYEAGYEFGPGSPSFREYYVESVDNSVTSVDTSKEEDADADYKENAEKKSRRKESMESNEGSATRLVKKENKRRRFRRALPKGLSVRSCYTPPCTSAPDESQQGLNAKVVPVA